MIDPDVLIEDLEPQGFGWLCSVLQRRRSPRWLWVLHESGRPLVAVDTEAGAVEPPQVLDPEALLAGSGAERVVVLDRALAGELSAAITERAQPRLTQQEWFSEAHACFWASPAVATAPAPPEPAWKEVLDRLSQLSPAVMLTVGDRLRLCGEFRDGRLIRLSSDDRPDALRLQCSPEAFEAALLAPDLPAALTRLLDQARSKP